MNIRDELKNVKKFLMIEEINLFTIFYSNDLLSIFTIKYGKYIIIVSRKSQEKSKMFYCRNIKSFYMRGFLNKLKTK